MHLDEYLSLKSELALWGLYDQIGLDFNVIWFIRLGALTLWLWLTCLRSFVWGFCVCSFVCSLEGGTWPHLLTYRWVVSSHLALGNSLGCWQDLRNLGFITGWNQKISLLFLFLYIIQAFNYLTSMIN